MTNWGSATQKARAAICAHGGKAFDLYYPSNRRRADVADLSRSQRAVDNCVLETDLPGALYGMVEEFTEKLTEKVREYVFLYNTGHPEYKNFVEKASR